MAWIDLDSVTMKSGRLVIAHDAVNNSAVQVNGTFESMDCLAFIKLDLK